LVIWLRLKWVFWPNFGKAVQRRGTDVSTPKNGSRDGKFCFGGIMGFYAVLRREFWWGNLRWGGFCVLLVSPRRVTEEGGPFMRQFVYLGELCVNKGLGWGSKVLLCMG
jgi:hypothetical protein